MKEKGNGIGGVIKFPKNGKAKDVKCEVNDKINKITRFTDVSTMTESWGSSVVWYEVNSEKDINFILNNLEGIGATDEDLKYIQCPDWIAVIKDYNGEIGCSAVATLKGIQSEITRFMTQFLAVKE